MRKKTLVVPLVALALSLPVPVLGQLAASEAVARLRVGQTIRLQAPGISVESGTVSELDGETLYVMEEGQEWLVEPREIERLEVRRRTIGKNVIIFGAIGALVGFGANKFYEQVNGRRFALLGVATGAVFGYTNWQWTVLYPNF